MNAPAWPYRIAAPAAADRQTRPPLLVLLHGIGADENDLWPLAPLLDGRCAVVSVRAPHPYGPGWAWFHIDWLPDGSVRPDRAQAQATLLDLERWMAAAPERFGTDPARSYLLGFSQGGMMALGLLLRAPELLAGVVALSSRAPDALFEATAPAEAIARVPLFVAHGIHDDVLPVANGRRIRELFSRLSRDLTYREFPVAHAIANDEIACVREWLAARL